MEDKTKRSPALKRAQAKYATKKIQKKVAFHVENDKEVIDYIDNNIPNFTEWVRQKVMKEINQ